MTVEELAREIINRDLHHDLVLDNIEGSKPDQLEDAWIMVQEMHREAKKC